MTKTKKSQKDRFTSFRNQHCPYCGTQGATLVETKTGYHGHCVNPECKADNAFSARNTKEWMEQ